jgi:hypothetical protein
MKLPAVPFEVMDWSCVPPAEHAGAAGASLWRVWERDGLRVRRVTYSPGYQSDHWCARGHVLMVVRGSITIRLKDGRSYELGPGMSFAAGDDETNPHLASSVRGADVFIVD